jgi:type IV pilus assembly protein PilY1
MLVLGGGEMKSVYPGKTILMWAMMTAMFIGVSAKECSAGKNPTYRFQFYIGDNNSETYKTKPTNVSVTPNGLGGTVKYYKGTTTRVNGHNTTTYDAGTLVTVANSNGALITVSKYDKIEITPDSSHKIKTASYLTSSRNSGQWLSMFTNLNANTTNTYIETFGNNSATLTMYVYFEPEIGNIYYTDVFPDVPVSSAFSACWKLVSIAGPTAPVLDLAHPPATDPPAAGPSSTWINNTTAIPPTIDLVASPQVTNGPYPKDIIDNFKSPTLNWNLHIDNTKFWFKLAKPADVTDIGCELDGISFDDPASYSIPPGVGTMALDISGCTETVCNDAANGVLPGVTANTTVAPPAGFILSGSYTPPIFDSTIGDAVIRFKFRHKGVYVSTSVGSAATYPACGTSITDNIVPAGQTYYAIGDTPSFVINVNSGCAISKVEVQNRTFNSSTGAFTTTSTTDVTAQITSNSYTFAALAANVHPKLVVTFVRATAMAGASSSYCQLPAFMGGVTPTLPNVLLIFDNSGSMAEYPYRSSQTYTCLAQSAGKGFYDLESCSNFWGYFDKSTKYTKTNGVWVPSNTGGTTVATDFSRKLGSTCSATPSDVSGNELNYCFMQKVDVVRKILVGGLVDDSQGKARPLLDDSAGANTDTNFVLRTNSGTYVDVGTTEPQGIIQQDYSKVRFGMMVFNGNGAGVGSSLSDDDGGHIINVTMPNLAPYSGNDFQAKLGADLAVLIAGVESDQTKPGSNTPLAETLYEAIRYYEAKTSAYNSVNCYGNGADPTCVSGGGAYDYGPIDPVLSSCQKHFVIILTDGQPTNDANVPYYPSTNVTDTDFSNWRSGLAGAGLPTPTTMLGNVAYYAHNKDLRSATLGKTDWALTQNLTIFTVYAFGDGSGKATLQDTAKYGAYFNEFYAPYSTTLSHNNKPDAGEYDSGYFEASDGALLNSQLNQALSTILASTASGTAAAVANNKSGERGANIIKALFYPQWPNNSAIKWLGDVMSLWYYLDPIISYSAIYEDDGDKILDLQVDVAPNSNPFLIKPLWSAGTKLQAMLAANRHIYTLLSSGSALTDSSNSFEIGNVATLKPLLNLSSLPTDNVQVNKLINYIRGTDAVEYRPRKVTLSGVNKEWKLGDVINSTPQVQSAIPINAYNSAYSDSSYGQFIASNQYKSRNMIYAGSNDGMLHVFKAGTVTPLNDSAHPFRIAQMSNDGTEGQEQWAFIPKNALPYLQNQAAIDYCHQCLVDGAPTVVDASINMPAGCSGNYWECGRKTTVSSSGDVDAANTSWKTVVVGSMGLGGATRLSAANCNITAPALDAAHNTDCVKSPMTDNGLSSYFALDVSDPATPKNMWEFSDKDITDAADKGLGFTTSGPAIVRINAVGASVTKADKTKNGRWFAVFASGPTGMINTSYQFTGRSDQNLKIYVVDLNSSPPFVKGTNYWVIGNRPASGARSADVVIPFAFANSLNGASIDLDRWNSTKDGYYSDDVVYITYTKASLTNYTTTPTTGNFPSAFTSPDTTAWNKGGVLRLVTNHNPDPSTWFTSSLIDNVGPITTSVGRLQDRNNKKLWVFFGEGRYFYPLDDVNHTRRFYGVADPCYKQYEDTTSTYSQYTGDSYSNYALGTTAASCPSVTGPAVTDSYTADVAGIDLQRQDTPTATLTAGKKGWYVNMAPTSGNSGAERVVSDVSAAYNGTVFFTTYIPTMDPCTPGGNTSMWATKYDTGGTASAESLKGKAPVQTSSGGISMIDLATAFTQNSGRKLSAALSPVGMTPKGKFPQLLQPKAIKQILKIQEQ